MSAWRWIAVVMPRGDIVRLDEQFCASQPAALFGMVLEGENEDGGRVTVRGDNVSLVWRSDEQVATTREPADG